MCLLMPNEDCVLCLPNACRKLARYCRVQSGAVETGEPGAVESQNSTLRLLTHSWLLLSHFWMQCLGGLPQGHKKLLGGLHKKALEMAMGTYTHDTKITPPGHPYTLVGMDLSHTHIHVGMDHPSDHPYPQKLNIYQNIILYRCQVYPYKYHYKIF
jgi:hypothetical protein